ncbi:fatty acid desaturase family protein [Agriterribacter sp.]|uniref:fatty acid desaturase family protein n=1 Tax=Agriterribacter sp. TaxID=2821509 RepID=UPI002C0D305D|nr:fatty acid desaturase [Agriterribacter sp.]HTN07394.1 fatty acid desaturase [Agriterribacter sp.]
MSTDILKAKKPYFAKDSGDIFSRLRQEAKKIVTRLSPQRRKEIIFKAFLFPFVYFLFWALALCYGTNLWVLFGCYGLMGLTIVLNYLNVIHDAVHHTIFNSRRINDMYTYLFDIMGANSFIWKTRHIRYHHNYPNVNGWDTDIDQSALVRIVPHATFSPMHKYQHVYLPFIYPLFLFNWLLVRDFKDFFSKKRTVQKLVTIPRAEYIKLLAFKIFFLFYLVILPKIVLGVSWLMVVSAFCVLILSASIFALMVLLPPHANTASEFPLPDSEQQLPYGWMLHMLKTTNDVNGESWFTRFVMGNYNYHIAHHLFPNIHHTYYPEITRVLKQLSDQYNLPYRSYPLFTSLSNHYLLLKQNRVEFDIWEESM